MLTIESASSAITLGTSTGSYQKAEEMRTKLPAELPSEKGLRNRDTETD